MSNAILMPSLSPTMKEGTLARWLVKVGDTVSSGDILAEIETDTAAMELEALDEGVIISIDVAQGTEGVKVGTLIATLAGKGEGAAPKPEVEVKTPTVKPAAALAPVVTASAASGVGPTVRATPLAKRIAGTKEIDLSGIAGSGPNGRIVKADVEAIRPGAARPTVGAPVSVATAVPDFGIPHEDVALSGMRKTIARRLTESKQQVPHIYLTVDIRLDALLKLRGELNEAMASREVKLSVNDMLIKALGNALALVPSCNVAFVGDTLRQYHRADISVAVSIPNGLITPIITDADSKSLSRVSIEMADLANRAKAGKLASSEYQGGTASLSNMGMMGIKQFEAIINPPQGMIMAIGAGEKRPWVMEDGALGVATTMCATGSFDHRAIDGADGAQLMVAFRELIENPLALIA